MNKENLNIHNISKYLLSIVLLLLSLNIGYSQCAPGNTYRVLASDNFGSGVADYGPPLTNITTGYVHITSGQIAVGGYGLLKNPKTSIPLYWSNAPDHTGNPNGYMLVVNADNNPGIFYETTYSGLCEGINARFSIFVANVCHSLPHLPNVTINIMDVNTNAIIATVNSGNLAHSPVNSLTWHELAANFTVPIGASAVKVQVVNNTLGTNGNDVAFDDVSFSICVPESYPFSEIIESTTTQERHVLKVGLHNSVPVAAAIYQWQRLVGSTWVDITGETTDTYTTPLEDKITRSYRCRYANGGVLTTNNENCTGAQEFNMFGVSCGPKSIKKVLVTEDFGNGASEYGPALPVGITAYTYTSTGAVNPGRYGLLKNPHISYPVQAWWTVGTDHTGDNGYMLTVNAAGTPDVFYTKTYDNLCEGSQIIFSAFVANCVRYSVRETLPVLPDVTINILNPLNNSLLQTITSGEIPYSKDNELIWHELMIDFVIPSGISSVIIEMRNNATGTSGNDIVFDDISFSVCVPEYTTKNELVSESRTHESRKLTTEITPGIISVPQYQWQKLDISTSTWIDISGATQKEYTTPFELKETRYYRCRFGAYGLNITGINNYNCTNEAVFLLSGIVQANEDIACVFECDSVKVNVLENDTISTDAYIKTITVQPEHGTVKHDVSTILYKHTNCVYSDIKDSVSYEVCNSLMCSSTKLKFIILQRPEIYLKDSCSFDPKMILSLQYGGDYKWQYSESNSPFLWEYISYTGFDCNEKKEGWYRVYVKSNGAETYTSPKKLEIMKNKIGKKWWYQMSLK